MGGKKDNTKHGKVTPNTHPPTTTKSPKPPIPIPVQLALFPLLPPVAILLLFNPPRVIPPTRVRIRRDISVQTPSCGADSDAGGDFVAADVAGGGGRDAGLAAGDGGFEAEGFHYDGVEDGEAVEVFGGGELDV